MTAPTTSLDELAMITAQLPDDEVDIKDFTVDRKYIKFKIDNDVFDAYPVIGAPVLQQVSKVASNIDKTISEGDLTPLITICQALLVPTAAERFVARLQSSDGDQVLDLRRQVVPVLFYLLERHGLRPTQPSSDSSAG